MKTRVPYVVTVRSLNVNFRFSIFVNGYRILGITAQNLLQISVALIGGPGWDAADDWAALCAGLVIIYNDLKQTRPALWELRDTAPEDASLATPFPGKAHC
jgi:hypothetical protein